MSWVDLVSDQDYEALAAFLARFPDEKRGPEFWRRRLAHWWEDNPAFSQETQRGWVVRDNDSIVGFLGNIPSLFKLRDQTVVVFNASTWRVLPEFRGRSLELLGQLMACSKDTISFITTSGRPVLDILDNLKFEPFPHLEPSGSYSVTALEKVI